MGCNGLNGAGKGWKGLEWTGKDWTGLEGTGLGLKSFEFAAIDFNMLQ